MYALGWYTTLFVNSLSFPYIVGIFDLFLAEGQKVLFQFAIALLKSMQKILLAEGFEGVILKLKNLGKYLPVSPTELVTIAMEFTLSNKRMDKLSKEYDAQNEM